MTTSKLPKKKKKHVASSARIFTTGLTATAVLGLTSTLALAKPSWSDSSSATTPNTTLATPLIPAAVVPATLPTQSDTPANSESVTTPTAPPPTAGTPEVSATAITATNGATTNNTQSQVVVTVPVPVPPSIGNNTNTPSRSNGS